MLGMTSGADWLIAGLGNPEPKYDGTRHNAGFEALDYLAAQWGCSITKAKWQGLYGTAQVGQHKVVLLKPLTYMNLSGQSIAPAANFYKIPADHVIVLCDDITQEPVLEQNPDSVEYFIIPGDYECQVMYQGSDEWLETSMLAEYAEGANAYGVFLGGDNKLFKIQNQDPTMKNGKKIAVLKESFGNAFVPFLSPHYSEVHVLDMRYWEGNLASYAAENGIDEILIMNNIKSACNYTFHDYLLAMT